MPEAQKLSKLRGRKRLVAFKIGHYTAYPKGQEFECHDVISAQLKECLGQSSIPLPALAAKYADHRGHGGHSSTSSRVRVPVYHYHSRIFSGAPPLPGSEHHITHTD